MDQLSNAVTPAIPTSEPGCAPAQSTNVVAPRSQSVARPLVERFAAAELLSGIESGTWSDRLAWLVLFLIPTAVLLTAALLSPNPMGHSTHTQLGLPPCGFLVFSGFPCPGCGLTTAFAHMVRLQVAGAWHANPFGVVLFTATAAFIPFAATGLVRGWSLFAALDRIHAEKLAIGLALLSMASWVSRLVLICWL